MTRVPSARTRVASPNRRPVVVPHKVQVPRPGGLRRPRLDARVLAALQTGQVLIVAPPGAGKTTLLGQVARALGVRVGWYTAGPEEAHPATLVRYLARALGRPETEGTPDGSPDELLAVLDHLDPQVLVIDDLHELWGTPAEAVLERLITCCPDGLHLLLGTRREPGFNTPRLLAAGQLTQFDGDDLRFRSWESEALFRTLYEEPLSPESAALLTRRVGGFAAALQLFHLTVRGRTRSDREGQVRQLSGRSPLMRSYLARTVLDALSPERRDFLLRTNVLTVLTAPLCDALLERSDSALILHELTHDQLFTTTDDGVRYQYHEVLRDHLDVTLEDEVPAQELVQLRLRAAGLLEEAGHTAAALRAYQRAGDWGAASRLVRQHQDTAPWAPRGPGLSSPHDPWLDLAYARSLLRRGAVSAGIETLAEIEQSVADPELLERCRTERHEAALWLPDSTMPVTSTAPLARLRALTMTPADPRTPSDHSPTSRLLNVLASLIAGDFTAARQAVDVLGPTDDAPAWVPLTAGLVDIALELTDPADPALTASRLEDLSLTADVGGYPWLGRLARGLQACILIEESGEDRQRLACAAVVESCVQDGDQWGELLLRILWAVTLARLSRVAEARAEFEYATGLCHVLGAPRLGRWVEGYLTALGPTVTATTQPDAELVDLCRISLRPREAEQPGGQLLCLGGFRLRRAGAETQITALRPRARLLLMRLAMQHSADVHREDLIDALWPETALATGLRRLQTAVSSIRQVLEAAGWGDDCLPRHGDAYRLQLSRTVTDVQQLETVAVEVGRLREPPGPDLPAAAQAGLVERLSDELLGLYRGDLLPEIGPTDWVLWERDRLRILTASALATLGQSGLACGHAEAALPPVQRLVEIDPFRDTAWLLLARIQRALGDHNAAEITLAAYHRVGAELRAPDLT